MTSATRFNNFFMMNSFYPFLYCLHIFSTILVWIFLSSLHKSEAFTKHNQEIISVIKEGKLCAKKLFLK
ncbi:Uncharacterised protein [Streptococcus pneumoniae]|nr:Uncharacterised protein [Streptococcus pneumoniae]CRG03052.1 Uncharacterised protein [Streptococcus pneumoniae]